MSDEPTRKAKPSATRTSARLTAKDAAVATPTECGHTEDSKHEPAGQHEDEERGGRKAQPEARTLGRQEPCEPENEECAAGDENGGGNPADASLDAAARVGNPGA